MAEARDRPDGPADADVRVGAPTLPRAALLPGGNGPYLLFVALAAFALYAKTLGFGFQEYWDDGEYIVNNPYLAEVSFANLVALLTRPFVDLYTPVTMLSFFLDRMLMGPGPFGFHLSNVLLHALNAVLVFALVQRVSSSRALALFVALVFAVHPLNAEPVAWLSQRKTLLSAVFGLASVLFYLRYRHDGGRVRYWGFLAGFVLAVFAKPSAVTLPLVLVAYEVLLVPRFRRRFLPIIPLFLVAALQIALSVAFMLAGGATKADYMTFATLFGNVYPTMLPVYWDYLRLLLLPTELTAVPTPRDYYSFLAPVVAVALAGALAVFLWVFLKGSREIRFWFLWALLLFLPMANLVPMNFAAADRYMYLSQIGFFAILGLAGSAAYRWAAARSAVPEAAGSVAYLLALALFAGVYAGLAFTRAEVWRTPQALWEDTVAKSPRAYVAHLNLGVAYATSGRLEEAEREFLQALELKRTQAAYENLLRVRAEMSQRGLRQTSP